MNEIRCSQCKVVVPLAVAAVDRRCISPGCPVNAAVARAAGADLLSNIQWELDEISIAHSAFCADYRAMQDELCGRNVGGARDWAASAAKRAGQIQIMLDHIAVVLQRDGYQVSPGPEQITGVAKESVG